MVFLIQSQLERALSLLPESSRIPHIQVIVEPVVDRLYDENLNDHLSFEFKAGEWKCVTEFTLID